MDKEEKMGDAEGGGADAERGAPEGGVPEDDTPKGDAPEEGVPEESVPEGSAPECGAPESDVPKGNVPEGGAPEGDVPEGNVPEGNVPEGNVPEGGVAEGGVAEGGVAEGGVAEGGVAEGGVAEGGLAAGGMAEGGVAEGGVAEGAAPTRNLSDNNDNVQRELNLSRICEGVFDSSIFHDNLTIINMSYNELKEVPKSLLDLPNIVKLDLSNNLIESFNDTPKFVNTIKEFSLAYNSLTIPPLWIWKDAPSKLEYLNLSENVNMVYNLKEHGRIEYFHCWLYVAKIIMFNCRLHTGIDILYTLNGVDELILGSEDITAYRRNELCEFPLECLACIKSKKIVLTNCKIYDINRTITNYTAMTHLDISVNFVAYLPDELGELLKLEELIMSRNKLESLPDSMVNLKNLRVLLICQNFIERLPDKLLIELPELKCLDMHDNCLETLPEGHENLSACDFSLNYAREPEQPEYIEKRTELRNKYTNGRGKGKFVLQVKIKPDNDDSDDDYEESQEDNDEGDTGENSDEHQEAQGSSNPENVDVPAVPEENSDTDKPPTVATPKAN